MANIPEPDISIDSGICLKQSQLSFIDKYRVNHGYRNRSDYVQQLVDHDIHFNRFDNMVEMMSMLLFPMMGFFFFMLLAVLTAGLLFYLFMSVFGIVSVFLCYMYYRKHKIKKNNDNMGG
jgi:hypothetical protein